MWKEHIALKDRLVFSFKKYNFQRIVDALTHCLSFFYLFAKEFIGIFWLYLLANDRRSRSHREGQKYELPSQY